MNIYKKRKLGQMEMDIKISDFPKSEILKQLTLEQQTKYRKLDNYLENITSEELENYSFNRDILKAMIQPYDRMLFVFFMKKIYDKEILLD